MGGGQDQPCAPQHGAPIKSKRVSKSDARDTPPGAIKPRENLALLTPGILALDLLLLLGGEIVLDVKVLSDLFRGLALDHFSDRLAGKVEPEFRM